MAIRMSVGRGNRKSITFQHPDGHRVTIANRFLSPRLMECLKELSIHGFRRFADGGDVQEGDGNTSEPFDTSKRYAHQEEVPGSSWGRNVYTPERQEVHKGIIGHFMDEGAPGADPRWDKPEVVFLGGPPGAGKSTVRDKLQKAGVLDPNRYMTLDPDEVKGQIPEYRGFQKSDPSKAASAVHRESGDIQEDLWRQGQAARKSMIVDSTLGAQQYYSDEIDRLKSEYPEYGSTILHVDVPERTAQERVESRGRATGRVVRRDTVSKIYNAVGPSIDALKNKVDTTIKFDNRGEPFISAIYEGGERVNRTVRGGRPLRVGQDLEDVVEESGRARRGRSAERERTGPSEGWTLRR